MVVYWAGGEDVDFLTLGAGLINTSSTFRSGWARCSIYMPSNSSGPFAKSFPFGGGAVTSAWLSYRVNFNAGSGSNNGGPLLAGFGLSGTNLYIGVNSAGQIVTSSAILATPGANLLANGLNRIDIQVTNYGASGTVSVYVGGTLMVTYGPGNIAVGGMTNFDSVFLGWNSNGSSPLTYQYSEIIVADSDTRAIMGLNTLALTGAGTTDAWSNHTYTNINGISYSDASPAYSNTNGQDQEYAVGTAQPSVFSVVAVVQSARAAIPAGSTPAHLNLGYGSAGTGYFGTGAQKTPAVGFSSFQQIDAINPITGVAWVQGDITAPLQLDLQSAA